MFVLREKEMSKRAVETLWFLFVMASCYVAIATCVYRFRHPERSETELFIEMPKILLFK